VGCSVIPEITVSEVGDEILMQLGTRRYPLGGSLEVTERCNLACLHCFINQPAGNRDAAAGELTLPQVRNVLDQMAGAGCLFLLITGGEALLRPDFREIWSYAKRKGMLVSLFTNGTLVTPRIADFLAEWRPGAVEISCGATQDTYERVTQVPGSYTWYAGHRVALDRGLRLNKRPAAGKPPRTCGHECLAGDSGCRTASTAYLPPVDGDRARPEVVAGRGSPRPAAPGEAEGV
jgi:hypothetical protein